MKVIGDRLLIKPETVSNQTPFGLVLNTANERPRIGEVLSVGGDVEVANIGDKVMFHKLAGTMVDVEGQEYLVIRREEILLIL